MWWRSFSSCILDMILGAGILFSCLSFSEFRIFCAYCPWWNSTELAGIGRMGNGGIGSSARVKRGKFKFKFKLGIGKAGKPGT